jgi:protein gp37
MGVTKISWTATVLPNGDIIPGYTWNPWIGCTKVSDGCKFCYAEDMMDTRYGKVEWGDSGTRVRTSVENWKKPYAWNRQAAAQGVKVRVFTASLSDFFEKRAELEPWRAEALRIMSECRNLTWLLLTKRPEYVNRMLHKATGDAAMWLATNPHVWIGTSVENQKWADKRIPELLAVPTPNRFLSAEPLLGSIELNYSSGDEGINWLIVGGESGSNARPMQLEWAQAVMAAGRQAGMAVFFKQTGTVLAKALGLKHKKGEDPQEWAAFAPDLTQELPRDFYPLAWQVVNE